MATTASCTTWALLRAAPAGDSMAASSFCRFCGARLEDTFVDLGTSPLCEKYVAPHQLSEPDRYLPASCVDLPAVPAGAARCGRAARGDLLGVRVFLVVFRQLGRPRAHLRRRGRFSVSALGAGQPDRRDRLQRRIPPPALCGARPRRAGNRAGRQRGEGGRKPWHPDGSPVLRPRRRRGPQRPARARRSPDRQQRPGSRPRSQRLRGRDERAAGAGRRDHDGVPAPGAAHRAQPVRHHLSRALFLLLVPHGRAHLRRTRPENLRRRGAHDPRRLAENLRGARGTEPGSPDRSRRAASQSGTAGRLRPDRTVRGFQPTR